jgi:hypothetical protein
MIIWNILCSFGRFSSGFGIMYQEKIWQPCPASAKSESTTAAFFSHTEKNFFALSKKICRLCFQRFKRKEGPFTSFRRKPFNLALAAAWCSGIVSACHLGDWS